MPGAAAPLAAFTARLAPPHSNAPQIHSSKRSHGTLPRQDGGGGLFLGHPLHPRVAPCWHPRGHMLQVLSSPIVECCPALPLFTPTHAPPARSHCRHSHKTLPQQPCLPKSKSSNLKSKSKVQKIQKSPARDPESEVQIQRSPKVQIPSPSPKFKKSIPAGVTRSPNPRSPKVQIRSPKVQMIRLAPPLNTPAAPMVPV